MNQAQERIIRLVRKLFALADKAGTQEEAHSAAMKARALLSEYSLTLADMCLAQIEDDMTCCEHLQTLSTSYTPSWVKILFGAVRRGFNCGGFFSYTDAKTGQNKKAVVFIGVEPDVSLAAFTFEYLYRIGKRCPGMERKKEKLKNQWRTGFVIALSSRFVQFLRLEQTTQENALVPVKDKLIERYTASRYPDLVDARPAAKIGRATKAFQAGYTHGKRIPLNKPIPSTGSSTLALGM